MRIKCRGCGGPCDRGPRKLCERCRAKGRRGKEVHEHMAGEASLRRLHRLRLRASAGLPLFTRRDRNAI